jgi:uncharacterized membrane protein YjgN (DUF898 family)
MRTRPFIVAAAISTVLQVLIILVVTGISYLAMSDFFDQLNFDQFPNPPSFSQPLILGLGGLSIVSCLVYPIVYMGTGWFYTYLHKKEGNLPLEIGALGGAASAGTAGLLAGIFTGLLTIVLAPILYKSFTNQIVPGTDFPYQSINMITSSLSSIFGACWRALVAAGLGALGGLIGGAIYNRQTGT